MDRQYLAQKLASRKFWLAVGAFVAFILSATGVIDVSKEAQVAEMVGVGIYMVVEGLRDAIAARGK
ncbi:hypothetical protein HRbin24_00541 [bacterium HR24]|nr:hypothetical protein HRbin24_00541 [bacterium HR24]